MNDQNLTHQDDPRYLSDITDHKHGQRFQQWCGFVHEIQHPSHTAQGYFTQARNDIQTPEISKKTLSEWHKISYLPYN